MLDSSPVVLPTSTLRICARARAASTVSKILFTTRVSKRWPAKSSFTQAGGWLTLWGPWKPSVLSSSPAASASARWFTLRSWSMYAYSRVSCPPSATTAPRTGGGSASVSPLPNARGARAAARAGRKARRQLPKCSDASRGSSEGRWSTAWKSTPGSSRQSEVSSVSALKMKKGCSMLVNCRVGTEPSASQVMSQTPRSLSLPPMTCLFRSSKVKSRGKRASQYMPLTMTVLKGRMVSWNTDS
mmetsp:Transcript_25033/g.79593  ORF Transcript_25033/g.79593 Transcript_25033/m.79593 type:complete len:243 (-) Transcript_25033:711-1439(-)